MATPAVGMPVLRVTVRTVPRNCPRNRLTRKKGTCKEISRDNARDNRRRDAPYRNRVRSSRDNAIRSGDEKPQRTTRGPLLLARSHLFVPKLAPKTSKILLDGESSVSIRLYALIAARWSLTFPSHEEVRLFTGKRAWTRAIKCSRHSTRVPIASTAGSRHKTRVGPKENRRGSTLESDRVLEVPLFHWNHNAPFDSIEYCIRKK